MKNKNMTEMEILTQTLNEMVGRGELNMISRFDKDNPTDEELYVKAEE